MFTGLIEECAQMLHLESQGDNARLTVAARKVLQDVSLGDSIAVNGVCLSVVAYTASTCTFDVSSETLTRSAFSALTPGNTLNLERAMAADKRFGGHIVQGHVDGVGYISALRTQGAHHVLDVRVPRALVHFIAEKGSITIDGISLTIAQEHDDICTVAVIPHTFTHTNLHTRTVGNPVNIEVDVLARYLYKMLRSGVVPHTHDDAPHTDAPAAHDKSNTHDAALAQALSRL